MEKQNEKRQAARFRVPTLVKYKGAPNFTDNEVANIRDISLQGMAFLAQRPVEKGSSLELSFLSPNGDSLAVKGVVLHCEKITKNPDSFKIGVRFEEVREEVREWLSKVETFFLSEQKNKKD